MLEIIQGSNPIDCCWLTTDAMLTPLARFAVFSGDIALSA